MPTYGHEALPAHVQTALPPTSSTTYERIAIDLGITSDDSLIGYFSILTDARIITDLCASADKGTIAYLCSSAHLCMATHFSIATDPRISTHNSISQHPGGPDNCSLVKHLSVSEH